MHHTNMVRDVVAGLQEFMQQEQAPKETTPVVSEPNEYVSKTVQNTQQKLAAQLQ